MKKEKIKYYKYIGKSQGAYVYGQVYTLQISDLPNIIGSILIKNTPRFLSFLKQMEPLY